MCVVIYLFRDPTTNDQITNKLTTNKNIEDDETRVRNNKNACQRQI